MKNRLGLPIFLLSFYCICFTRGNAQAGADSLLNFIKQNESRSSLYLVKNDTVIAALNENKLMPLASTVKIIVAIEFAKQAAARVFDENSKIPVSELEKYYIPFTDGGAYPKWLSYEKSRGHLTGDSVKLIDVARGMIIFSSNANTEYLMDLLGFNNIESNLQLLGLKQHTPIYPLVASLFLYQNPKHLSDDDLIKQISSMNNDAYAHAAFLIHQELKNDSNYRKKFRLQDLTLKLQKEWSDRLPASTAKEYVQLCYVLNHRKFFGKETYAVLSKILETLMENPANAAWLDHAGMKGGSTIFVLTKALYATLKDGTRIEMAYFFNDLTGDENAKLQHWMNDFELKVLSDEAFRKQIVF
ncbi:MAG TPA: serine hydrolase [Chitinophagaceae bacterium]|nr:serine hydrolase [Chitinophagaceae bacterium]